MASERVHAEFRTVVEVGEALSVTGMLPGTRWRPKGGVAISGDVHLLWSNCQVLWMRR